MNRSSNNILYIKKTYNNSNINSNNNIINNINNIL